MIWTVGPSPVGGEGEIRPHSGVRSIVGMTPWSMLIARRLIFWNLLTLQKSVTHTVKSANDPLETISGKRSLLRRVTISNADVTTRSIEEFVRRRFREKHNQGLYLSKPLTQLRRQQTLFSIRTAYSATVTGASVADIAAPCRVYQDSDFWSSCVQTASKSLSGIWKEGVLLFPKIAWQAAVERLERRRLHEDCYDSKPRQECKN